MHRVSHLLKAPQTDCMRWYITQSAKALLHLSHDCTYDLLVHRNFLEFFLKITFTHVKHVQSCVLWTPAYSCIVEKIKVASNDIPSIAAIISLVCCLNWWSMQSCIENGFPDRAVDRGRNNLKGSFLAVILTFVAIHLKWELDKMRIFDFIFRG